MNADEQARLTKMLKETLPPIAIDADSVSRTARDLWPAVLRRLDQRTSLPWFDWALLAGLGVFAAATPAWIPVILYFL